jgi:hypothetical protein
MKKLYLIAAMLGLSFTAFTTHAQNAKPNVPTIVTQAKDVKFFPLDPNDKEGKGVLVSVVFGDLSKPEPVGFLAKVPAGTVPGAHTHGSDYYGIALRGKSYHFRPGKDEGKVIENGATWFQAKDVPHNNRCEGPEACLIFMYYPGGFSFTPVSESK